MIIPADNYAFDDDYNKISNYIFQIKDQIIQLINSMMPAMLTLDELIILQGGLCYLMGRMPQSHLLGHNYNCRKFVST